MTTPTTPQARRGTKPGQKQATNYAHVCPAENCPRGGEPFMGTQKAVYCSRLCNLREWRKRKAAEGSEEAPA